MAFCPKCGKPFEENASNCAYCGAKNPAAPAAANNTVNEIVNKAKSLNKKNIAILAGAAVAVIVVIILISSIFGGGYKKAIDNYFDFTVKGEISKLEKLAPEDFWEELEDEYDVKPKDLEDTIEDDFEFALEAMEDEYGKNIKVKYKVIEKEKMDEDDLDEIKDNLKDSYGIAKKSVKKALEVELEVTIKGKDDEDTNEMDLVLVKIGGDWYVTSNFAGIKNYAY